jgi:hypothetical protein
MLHRLQLVLSWLLFAAWLLAPIPFVVGLAERGLAPIDFLAYQRAAEAIAKGQTPYATAAESREIFRSFHRFESELLAAQALGDGPDFLREAAVRPQQPGPYVYPPTLALWINQFSIDGVTFTSLIMLSVLGFSLIWLRATGAHAGWLLLVVGSRDLLATVQGGNVELLLLFASLAAARLIWGHRLIWATPLVALVVLIKPFYALFFVAFLLLRAVQTSGAARDSPRALIGAGGVLLLLLAAELYRWGPDLRAEALAFYLNAGDALWTALPLAEQSPLSVWNRTPLQGLINLGVPLLPAQIVALGLWGLFLGVTLWLARRVSLSFPLAFGLALTLLYWGRPAGYGFNYLQLVVAVAVWPSLRRWQRLALLVVVAGIMGSRWWAFVATLRGENLSLLTMQTAEWPWETWLVLPFFWLLLLWAMTCSRCPDQDPEGGREAQVVPHTSGAGRTVGIESQPKPTRADPEQGKEPQTLNPGAGHKARPRIALTRSLDEPQETAQAVWAFPPRGVVHLAPGDRSASARMGY